MSEYKKKVLKDLEAAAQRSREQTEIAFDSSRAVDERINALQGAASISQDESFRKAMAVVDDTAADGRLRAAALGKMSHLLGSDGPLLEKTIAMTTDTTLPDALRESAVRVLQANTFSSPNFPAQRPAYLGALRTLVDDGNRDLADVAIEYLALDKDEYVQRRLMEGLENPDQPELQITAPERAVQYLSYDLHADHFPILRKLAKNPPNSKTRMEALRNLAADSDSVGLMRETLADKDEEPEVRHLCAVALQGLDPANLDAQTDSIIEDPSESEALKVALINTKIHTPGVDRESVAADLGKVGTQSAEAETRKGTEKLSQIMAPKVRK